tara:strand:- start:5775 stop:6320 length:546 start_codon:yes stop_codon:yes gene_type:complete
MAGPDLSPLIQAYQNKGALTRAKAAAPVDNFLNSYGKARASRRAKDRDDVTDARNAKNDARLDTELGFKIEDRKEKDDFDNTMITFGGVTMTTKEANQLVAFKKLRLALTTANTEIKILDWGLTLGPDPEENKFNSDLGPIIPRPSTDMVGPAIELRNLSPDMQETALDVGQHLTVIEGAG